jgi:glutathione reductase (NADPH)
MKPADVFDIAVIGAGPAGAAAAVRAAELGARVALIDRHRTGGTCTNTGCVPTRALAIIARLLRDIRASSSTGVEVASPSLDWDRALQHARNAIASVNGNKRVAQRLAEAGGQVFLEGSATFLDPHTVELADTGRRIWAGSLILATGGEARRPSLPGIELATFPEDILRLNRSPRSAVIVGSGYTGVQMATILAAFGARVRLLESAAEILPPADADVSRTLHEAFRRQGIAVETSTGPLRAIVNTASGRRLDYTHSDGTPTQVEAEAILLCLGWPAAVRGLGLDKAGVSVDRGFVPCDASLRTNVRHILVAGDANGRDMLVQGAEFEGRHAADNAVQDADAPYVRGLLPSGGFTDPDHAGVGLTEAAARAADPGCLVETVRYAELDRALIDGRTTGFLKLIAERRSGRLLGAHCAGENAVELIQTAAVAMAHDGTVGRLASVRLAYPTYGALLGEAARRLERRLAPGVREGGRIAV